MTKVGIELLKNHLVHMYSWMDLVCSCDNFFAQFLLDPCKIYIVNPGTDPWVWWIKNKQPIADSMPMRFCSTNRN